jgi:hypothetical protein
MRNEGSATERGQLRIFELKLRVAPAQLSAGKFFVIEIALLAPVRGNISLISDKLTRFFVNFRSVNP